MQDFKFPYKVDKKGPKGISIKSWLDKEKLGLAAAAIRKIRPPEPYKGKGVKYAKEHIQRKAGKAGVSS